MGSCLLVASFANGTAGQSPGRPDPVAVLKRHVAAVGGADRLAKVACTTVKLDGTTLTAAGQMAPIRSTLSFAPPDRARVSEAATGCEAVVQVVGRDGGSIREGDRPAREMTAAELLGLRQSLYAAGVRQVAPVLADQAFKLTATLSVVRDGRTEHGVRVARLGQQSQFLYFDAETHLLVGVCSRITENLIEELRLSDYKEFGGVKYPTRQRRTVNGKPVLDLTATEVRFSEKIDEAAFARP